MNKVVFIISFLFSLAACSDQQIPFETIYSSNHCAVTEEQLVVIHSMAELKKIVSSKPKTFIQKTPVLPNIDFEQQSLVLLAIGQKPTVGYSLQITGKQALLDDEKLILPISIINPDPSMMHAQVITSPCKVLSLPKIQLSDIVMNPSLDIQK